MSRWKINRNKDLYIELGFLPVEVIQVGNLLSNEILVRENM